MHTGKIGRRAFLRRGMAAAGGLSAFPYFVPAPARGADGNIAPSNRVVMGCIGMGLQGCGNLEVLLQYKEIQVVAVCDVDREHRLKGKAMADGHYGNQDCSECHDFRELLARPDLNAVLIAVPDHWHVLPAIAAAERGLDIYGEKPLALTIPQGRSMLDAVNRYGVVWQTGSWQRSQDHFRHACELVRSGRIGRVHAVEVGLPTGEGCPPQPEMPVPDGFDYDFWLGPAPWSPYTEKRCHENFRWNFDYSGGQLTDWGAHHCDIANWGMGTEDTGPTEIEGKGVFPADGLWNTAIDYTITCRYPKGVSPVAPGGFTMSISNKLRSGVKFVGESGWVYVDRSGLETSPTSLADSEIGPNDVHLYNSQHHAVNFLECIRSRAKTISPIETAHHAIAICHLGNIAMKLERKMEWDPEKERFINDPEADRLLSRAMRGTWHL